MNVTNLHSGKEILQRMNGSDVGCRFTLNIILLSVFAVLLSAPVSAQKLTSPQQASLPTWIGTALEQLDSPDRYEFSSRLNPFYMYGDFNGDNKQDVAIWIRNRESNKSGIAIIHQGKRNIYLVGAGNPIVNGSGDVLWEGAEGSDSLDFIDDWLVYLKGGVDQGVEEEPPPTLKGDALLLIETESASGLIYWTGKHYAWYQQSD